MGPMPSMLAFLGRRSVGLPPQTSLYDSVVAPVPIPVGWRGTRMMVFICRAGLALKQQLGLLEQIFESRHRRRPGWATPVELPLTAVAGRNPNNSTKPAVTRRLHGRQHVRSICRVHVHTSVKPSSLIVPGGLPEFKVRDRRLSQQGGQRQLCAERSQPASPPGPWSQSSGRRASRRLEQQLSAVPGRWKPLGRVERGLAKADPRRRSCPKTHSATQVRDHGHRSGKLRRHGHLRLRRHAVLLRHRRGGLRVEPRDARLRRRARRAERRDVCSPARPVRTRRRRCRGGGCCRRRCACI